MDNVKLTTLNAYLTNGMERIDLYWDNNGEQNSCSFFRQFDTKKQWRGKTSRNTDKELLKELFCQFVDQAALVQR